MFVGIWTKHFSKLMMQFGGFESFLKLIHWFRPATCLKITLCSFYHLCRWLLSNISFSPDRLFIFLLLRKNKNKTFIYFSTFMLILVSAAFCPCGWNWVIFLKVSTEVWIEPRLYVALDKSICRMNNVTVEQPDSKHCSVLQAGDSERLQITCFNAL